jgi:sporulation protein YlmC with PRC-barrel domain
MTGTGPALVATAILSVMAAAFAQEGDQPGDQPGGDGTTPTVSSSQVIGAQGADEWLASQLRGTTVVGPDNERIGEVVDVLLDHNGQARAFIVGVGGVMGLGAKEIAIDLAQFHDKPAVNAQGVRAKLKVSLSREALAAVPEFKPLPVPDATTGAAPR